MIIERIHIDRFGALEGVTVEGLDGGVEVLHGTNETGKTSLLEFVRGVLFGFGHLFRRGILDPHLPCGGRLQARAGLDARRILVERRPLDRFPRRSGRMDQFGVVVVAENVGQRSRRRGEGIDVRMRVDERRLGEFTVDPGDKRR